MYVIIDYKQFTTNLFNTVNIAMTSYDVTITSSLRRVFFNQEHMDHEKAYIFKENS